jgi:hypothetical protein
MDGSSGNGSTGTLNTRKVDGKKIQVVEAGAEGQGRVASSGGIPTKSLMLIPERYRIRCVDELGLIARAVIVWSKPNGLPESVTDRVRRSHEDWVHLTKLPRYYSAIDDIREEHAPSSIERSRAGRKPHKPDSYTDGDARCPARRHAARPRAQPARQAPRLGLDDRHAAAQGARVARRRPLRRLPDGMAAPAHPRLVTRPASAPPAEKDGDRSCIGNRCPRRGQTVS